MRFEALAILGLLTVAACQERQGDETGRAVDAADTTIVTQDTTVDVDTVRHEGDQPVSEDTLREPSGTNAPSADTGSADTARQ